ncbi:hypothetical protein QUB56_09375 [Microcoleus sp. AR_TQ3_B6]|uniref:hypothetical protein n=1 Tax=Microcoleus sp. AR_TQ3_B6 TaxID=3055284 RepID=UPI002FD3628B
MTGKLLTVDWKAHHSQQSTVNSQQSTVNSQQSTVNRQQSTDNGLKKTRLSLTSHTRYEYAKESKGI